ncbi:Xaa-Pro peptidase family protein [Kribbella sp. NPDC050820]|uniref:Xaa-Pro peptidase family protein n=1 Tax=Kribbella sp. NPDC050820 TaxID=3155408 RepID=UPI0033ED3483
MAVEMGDQWEANVQAFETSEYRARLDGVRALMSDAGLDALLVTSEGNLCYLTGYEEWSPYQQQAVLVTLEDDPYLITRKMELRNAESTCWLPQDHLVPYAESYVGSAERSPWEAIGQFIKGRIGASARIGAELSGTALGVTAYAKLVDALGVEELRDATGLVSKCKRVKSERELAYMTEAAAIVDQAMLAGIDKIAVGTRQSDVAATIMSALCSGTESIPGGPPRQLPFMPVGRIANAPHLKWSDEVYSAGQQTNFEIVATRRRYCCPLARTAYLGSPPPRLKQVHDAVLDGWHAAIDAIRPGVRCSDVARAFDVAFRPHGIQKDSRIGYSVGLDWIDGGASLGDNDHSEIVADMTFHVIVGIWEPEEGYVFSEVVRVTDDGAEPLSNIPRLLFERPA